jgi:hypothetical protein
MSIQIIVMLLKFEKMNYLLKVDEIQPSQKKTNVSFNSISNFFPTKEPFKKDDVQKLFFGKFGSFNCQNHLPLQYVENSWLKRFNMHLCPIIIYVSRK